MFTVLITRDISIKTFTIQFLTSKKTNLAYIILNFISLGFLNVASSKVYYILPTFLYNARVLRERGLNNKFLPLGIVCAIMWRMLGTFSHCFWYPSTLLHTLLVLHTLYVIERHSSTMLMIFLHITEHPLHYCKMCLHITDDIPQNTLHITAKVPQRYVGYSSALLNTLHLICKIYPSTSLQKSPTSLHYHPHNFPTFPTIIPVTEPPGDQIISKQLCSGWLINEPIRLRIKTSHVINYLTSKDRWRSLYIEIFSWGKEIFYK